MLRCALRCVAQVLLHYFLQRVEAADVGQLLALAPLVAAVLAPQRSRTGPPPPCAFAAALLRSVAQSVVRRADALWPPAREPAEAAALARALLCALLPAATQRKGEEDGGPSSLLRSAWVAVRGRLPAALADAIDAEMADGRDGSG